MYIYQDNNTITHTENSISQTYNILADDVVGQPMEDVIVRIFAFSQIPQYYNGMPIKGFGMEQNGIGAWKVHVRWELQPWALQFDIGGATAHITQAKEEVAIYPGDGYSSAPSFNGAINVDKSGVHGCDVRVPSGGWTETYDVLVGQVTVAYEIACEELIKYPVNDAPFRGRERGEVLFLGMSGSYSSRDPRYYTLQYRFARERNRTGLVVPGITNPIDKEGWHYLWYRYAQTVDSATVSTIQKPLGAYVDRVYDYGDFSTLNIGTTRANAGWQGP